VAAGEGPYAQHGGGVSPTHGGRQPTKRVSFNGGTQFRDSTEKNTLGARYGEGEEGAWVGAPGGAAACSGLCLQPGQGVVFGVVWWIMR
jgi:hypothetical protein